MLEKISKRLEISSKEDGSVFDVIRAQDLMRDAFPVSRYGNAKASIWAAYTKLKLVSPRRCRSIWNGEARRIDAFEMTALERAALEEAQHQYARSQHNIAMLEAALRISDAEFHSPQIDAMQQLVGGKNSTVDKGDE